MNVHAPLPATKADFLKWIADQADARFEFVRGRIVDMTGAKRSHVRVASNIARILALRLDPARFEASFNDLAVDTPDAVRYPDVVVERAGAPADLDIARDPVVLIEILSGSSRVRDLIEKVAEFALLPSVAAYVVVDQDVERVRVWRREGVGFASKPKVLTPADGDVPLPEIGVALPFAELYRGVA
jgi:Uma2 family endonuclease